MNDSTIENCKWQTILSFTVIFSLTFDRFFLSLHFISFIYFFFFVRPFNLTSKWEPPKWRISSSKWTRKVEVNCHGSHFCSLSIWSDTHAFTLTVLILSESFNGDFTLAPVLKIENVYRREAHGKWKTINRIYQRVLALNEKWLK